MAMNPMGGSPLESPDADPRPGVARPSQLLGDEDRAGSSEDSSPDRQVSQVLVRVHGLEQQMETLASTYPSAAPDLRKAVKSLRDAAKKIVATGSGSAQETPNPRMLG